MPLLTDRAAIHVVLEADRAWSVYALGDFAPGYFENCRWYCEPGGLALLYCGFSPPIFFYIGEQAGAAAALDESRHEQISLQVRPEILPAISERYEISHRLNMLRMVLDPTKFAADLPKTGRLVLPGDLAVLEQLYTTEPPEFFFPSMVEQGVFFGAWQGPDLVAVAGTHLVNQEERVAAVGNVYTRPDCRGQGLASGLTAAVCAELLRLGITTIALNVKEENETAVRVYKRLGFSVHCPFVQAVASIA